MFKHFVIKNFRCFGSLHLKDLARVNLIAGMNNTGKTALLEAIQLHNRPNDCELPISINKTPGIPEPNKSPADLYAWLFHDKHTAGGAEIASWDDKGISRALSLWLLDGVTVRERFAEAGKQLQESFRPDLSDPHLMRLVLKYEQPGEVDRVSIAILGGHGLTWISARIPWTIPSIFLSSGSPSAEQDVKFFGELEAAKRQAEILPALQLLEPRLRRLSLVPLAGEAVIHADIGLPRLVPVPFMGEGMRRLLSLLLAIGNARDGVVLIDEIENGLHYSVMKKLWQALANAARQNQVQLFATSHSWECILKAHEAFAEGDVYDLRLHRIDRTDHQTSAVTHNREMIESALFNGIEMR